MRNTWKSVAALVCAGTLLVTGCGTMGDGNSSVSGTSKDGTTEIEVRSSEGAKDDDAAYANWREGWRMPSEDQFLELINEEYTRINYYKKVNVNV